MEDPIDLVVEVECLGATTIVRPIGEVDVYTSSLLRDHILQATSHGAQRVIADLQQTQFIDSTGMGVLITGLRRMNAQRGSFEIACSNPRILRLLHLMGIAKAVPVHEICPTPREDRGVIGSSPAAKRTEPPRRLGRTRAALREQKCLDSHP